MPRMRKTEGLTSPFSNMILGRGVLFNSLPINFVMSLGFHMRLVKISLISDKPIHSRQNHVICESIWKRMNYIQTLILLRLTSLGSTKKIYYE